MKQIIKWEAEDGTEFLTQEEAAQHEAIAEKVKVIVAPLGKLPDGVEFANGQLGYIQHDLDTMLSVRSKLLMLAAATCSSGLSWITDALEDASIHPTYPGRIIGEYSPRPIQKAWDRFYCIDRLGREWGQPFFRENPSAAPVQTEYKREA